MDTIFGQNPVPPVKERRRVQRFDLQLPARIETIPRRPDHAPVALNLTTRDISAFGAFFPSERLFEEGTRVKVDLTLVPAKPSSPVKPTLLNISGTVLRKGPEGIAMMFDERYKLAPLK
jgi:hypothetical protein